CLRMFVAESSFMPDHQLPETLSHIQLSDYEYDLPQERIASHPLAQRDHAKLLAYQQGEVSHHQFFQIGKLLPPEAMLVFNDTKVIHARLLFRRETGALIEVLLLHPESPREVAQAMMVQETCVWSCVVGRKKRWKPGEVLRLSLGENWTLEAELIDRQKNYVRFRWNQAVSWSEVVHRIGTLPLPPYLQREATEADEHQYQTVYAANTGAVAAPTAGLHFTNDLLKRLETQGIQQTYVTLHVSAGTFLPVKQEKVVEHDMHNEQMVIRAQQIQTIQANLGRIIPVGTTSMRLLESLYWLGVFLEKEGVESGKGLTLPQYYPYQHEASTLPSPTQALDQVLTHLDQHQLTEFLAETEIFILPGYQFHICRGLITNFHMPETTLMLLIAALVGEDWRQMYEAALENNYRFLSYGDSSLLLP
ncbi:MAG: S-adenosylmethionine:tRNA ribosyltransferase-isomerase, partial [Bacteroidota bacterium]